MGRSGRAAEQRRSGCDLEEQRHRERSLPSEGSDASPPLHDKEALLLSHAPAAADQLSLHGTRASAARGSEGAAHRRDST